MLQQIYNSNFITGLFAIFPDIGLNKLKFKSSKHLLVLFFPFCFVYFKYKHIIFHYLFILKEKYWADTYNQKKFFCNIAQQMGFDYKDAEYWYSIPIEKIEHLPVCLLFIYLSLLYLFLFSNKHKGVSSILYYHKGLANALLSLFPDIGLQKHRFSFSFSCMLRKEKRRE